MTKFIEDYFDNKELLTLALTHKSWVNEHPNERGSNERLEFLGDAVLEFVVSKEIYNLFPDKEEGYLTTLRANIVNTVNLAVVAEKLNVGKEIQLSKGEEDGGGRINPSILANTMEAIIGAIYLDRGVKEAEKFIKVNLLSDIPQKIALPLKDAKSRLQEYVQAKGHATPRYEVIEALGPDHDKKFTLEVIVDGKTWGKGEGKSKSIAAQNAAQNALAKIKDLVI
jgi:ribonuclease III